VHTSPLPIRATCPANLIQASYPLIQTDNTNWDSLLYKPLKSQFLLSRFGYMYYLKMVPLDRNFCNNPRTLIIQTSELWSTEFFCVLICT
jgi:hypothetical protein